jgi:pimeloyl-ACP methyl ester carboxylesterase
MGVALIAAALFFALLGCTTKLQSPDLGGIYNELIQADDPGRNPLIIVPGILGSKLKDLDSNTVVWGAFGPGSVNPRNTEGAQLIALPMGVGVPLADLRDRVEPDGVLDQVKVRFAGMDLRLKAYFYMLSTFGAAYRDSGLGESGAVDYGDKHYTCFQFAYDWRRDIVESARLLHTFIVNQRAYVQAATEERYGIKNLDVKFDIIAHSMGGLVVRYYLRYGSADLPADGSLPPLTWEGARYIENVVMVGTPNAGSVDTVTLLLEGEKFAPMFGKYEPAILGTMPAVYQLLPRSRHGTVINASAEELIEDIHDPALWERMGWGLADPRQDAVLQMLLPDVQDPAVRRRIALDHQGKALQRAKHVAAALDIGASPPAGLSLYLIAGDAVPTEAVVAVDKGTTKVVKNAPGDGTVLRSSALMDESVGTEFVGRLNSPIDWSGVHFLFKDHLGLTKDPGFSDNVLYFLFEKPR